MPEKQEPSDLDIRIGALQQEYAAHIAQLSNRAATLMSELASTQAQLKAALAQVAEMQKADVTVKGVSE